MVNRAGQQGDAVSADLIAEVLTGDADIGGSGGSQNIAIQVVPFLNGARVSRASSGHRSLVGTSALVTMMKWSQIAKKHYIWRTQRFDMNMEHNITYIE